jgi:hypothetical protein
VTTSATLLDDVVANFRDTGGMRTSAGSTLRFGRLLRSSALVQLGPRELEAVVAAAPQARYFDLRTDREVDRDGGIEPLVAHGWIWNRMPVQDEPDDEALAETSGWHERVIEQYLDAARGIAARFDKRPAIVACSLGKDRTGIVVALLLAALGVDREQIATDFEASTPNLAAQRHLLPVRWRNCRVTRAATGRECLDVVRRLETRSRADGDALDVRRLANLVLAENPHDLAVLNR